MTFKALHTGRPPYVSDLLQYHEPTRFLRSSSSHQLSVPHHNLTFGSCAFQFSTPRVWNSLPVSIRETKSLPTFRRHLKTLFSVSQSCQSVFSISLLICPSCLEYLSSTRPDSSKDLALYKPFIYLLNLAPVINSRI